MHFYSLIVDVQYLKAEPDLYDHFFFINYSAGSHGGAAKIQLDLATAECTLLCFSYRMCLINMADYIVQP